MWRRTWVKGPCVLRLLRDVLSHERSWPLPVKGWKMRHHRPDFKERPFMGVYVQERVSGGYKSTTMNTGPTSEPCCQLLLALRCRHKASLAMKVECRATVGMRTLTAGGTQRCQKNLPVNFIDWRKNGPRSQTDKVQSWQQSLFTRTYETQVKI